MPTIAELHIAKHEASKIKHPVSGELSSAYELQLLKLNNDRARLKKIQSRALKIELKKNLVPEYKAWIDGVLIGGIGMQDDVFMHLLVWTLDIGDLENALPMAQYALKYELVTPFQYKRQTATLIADEVGDTALKLIASGINVEPALLKDYIKELAKFDMHDQVRAKLHKALGLALENTDLTEAVEHLERALQLDAKCGVKKQLESILRKIKKTKENQIIN